MFDVRLRGRNGFNLGNLVEELRLERVQHAPTEENVEEVAQTLLLSTKDVLSAKAKVDKTDITVRVRSWTSTLKEIRRRAGLREVVVIKLRKVEQE